MHAIGFPLRVTEPERKLVLKIPSYYDFLQNKGSVCCTWAEYTAASGEIQVPRVGIYEWRRLLKLTQFCVTLSLYGHKTGSFKHRKAVSFLIGFCSDPHLWSWILGTDRNNIISGASGRDGIFAKSPWCDTLRQGAQLWNSQSLECRTTSPNWGRTDILARPFVQNAPRKTGEASPSG